MERILLNRPTYRQKRNFNYDDDCLGLGFLVQALLGLHSHSGLSANRC